MTKDNPLDHRVQELPCDDTQQHQQEQQNVFHIVLVDIEKTAIDKEVHCVEKPLGGVGDTKDDLRFVAISYRWGELQEQIVDTGLGYLASITSFALDDFYDLCRTIRSEPDLKSIKYVWVDAICVDQTNYERRKATIRQMSRIYENATSILAVPDLHKQHLINVSTTNADIIADFFEYRNYIYYLIQGNADALVRQDNAFLDDIDVPKDPMLRRLLTKYTHCFMEGFTHTCLTSRFETEVLVEELYGMHEVDATTTGKNQRQHVQTRYASIEGWLCRANKEEHHSRTWLDEVWTGKRDKYDTPILPWKHHIIKRNDIIRRIMVFLSDLIHDWSSRVWVISEYHMAKNKNNLKYWFLGLYMWGLPCFKFDFRIEIKSGDIVADDTLVDIQFHKTLIRQLKEKTFLEMMLNSKASKNEDRFYAILPHTKYKYKVNQVEHWEISSMVSVKLKLFEMMDVKDKLTLLYLSSGCCSDYEVRRPVLPSFATPATATTPVTTWAGEVDDLVQEKSPNFDLSKPSTITFNHCDYDGHLYYYLQVTPKKYSVLSKSYHYGVGRCVDLQKKVLCTHFKLDEHSLTIDFVRLSYFDENDEYKIYLAGSFAESIWTLGINVRCYMQNDNGWDCYDNDNPITVFNIF
ncbi:hypothetical protein BCR42DRAFT_496310 [Absidia repens]|uniref:Heterokaryon incompatibility domain-containing protein n=1 Tax=Absidia repens TaxID=90262 RepID=A0A1X2I1H5_9FUNG|nr:hypothetical protein BCR42DRAFT_496310 [Absidia repens]